MGLVTGAYYFMNKPTIIKINKWTFKSNTECATRIELEDITMAIQITPCMEDKLQYFGLANVYFKNNGISYEINGPILDENGNHISKLDQAKETFIKMFNINLGKLLNIIVEE